MAKEFNVILMMLITSIIAEQHGETKCVGSEESRHTHFDNREDLDLEKL